MWEPGRGELPADTLTRIAEVRCGTGVGDVLEMEPSLLHSGSPNYGGDIRIALIYRLLERT